jgi:SAM-dependent methyltransferase
MSSILSMKEKSSKWPKAIPSLTEEQLRIRDDFMGHWLEVLSNNYSIIERFNHRYALRSFVESGRTLEIGAGRGAHLAYERMDQQEYVAQELRPELAEKIKGKYPNVQVAIGDCQQKSQFADAYFDRVLAIHVLEHLPNLPRALDEVRRVLKPDGLLSVVIPCEGGMAYSIARRISARRIFEKRYKQSYDWLVACEHINMPGEILKELGYRFRIVHQNFFPMQFRAVWANLVIGLTLVPLH